MTGATLGGLAPSFPAGGLDQCGGFLVGAGEAIPGVSVGLREEQLGVRVRVGDQRRPNAVEVHAGNTTRSGLA